MSKYLLVFLLVLATRGLFADDFKTNAGKEYKNVTVSRIEPDGIMLITSSGVSKVYFTELPKEVQERFHYDAGKAANYSQEQAAAIAEYNKRITDSSTDAKPVQSNVEVPTTQKNDPLLTGKMLPSMWQMNKDAHIDTLNAEIEALKYQRSEISGQWSEAGRRSRIGSAAGMAAMEEAGRLRDSLEPLEKLIKAKQHEFLTDMGLTDISPIPYIPKDLMGPIDAIAMNATNDGEPQRLQRFERIGSISVDKITRVFDGYYVTLTKPQSHAQLDGIFTAKKNGLNCTVLQTYDGAVLIFWDISGVDSPICSGGRFGLLAFANDVTIKAIMK